MSCDIHFNQRAQNIRYLSLVLSATDG
jgi:hypothetical protein